MVCGLTAQPSFTRLPRCHCSRPAGFCKRTTISCFLFPRTAVELSFPPSDSKDTTSMTHCLADASSVIINGKEWYYLGKELKKPVSSHRIFAAPAVRRAHERRIRLGTAEDDSVRKRRSPDEQERRSDWKCNELPKGEHEEESETFVVRKGGSRKGWRGRKEHWRGAEPLAGRS